MTGIPYATAARFEPPAPAPDWAEPLVATGWPPICPHPPTPVLDRIVGVQLAGRRQDEHCQHLSVTLPLDVTPGESLPVMVWIHGGSYTSGAGDMPISDPAALVAEQRVVVVSVTYRLGIFGYLGDGHGRPANLGLLDQLAALRWVQRNITAFGGDPRQVTAFGESAGGDAVAHLMATPDAASLFSRAIIQSPPLGIARGRQRMNAAMAAAAAHVTPELPATEVVTLQPEVEQHSRRYGLIGAMPFGTQYGLPPLPAEEDVDEAWDRVAPDIDVLIGHTAEEARFFLPSSPGLERWTRLPVLGRLVARVVVTYVTAVVYARPIRRFAARHVRAGGRAHTYVVSWAAPGNPFRSAHAVDLALLFGDEQAWDSAELVAGASWTEIDRYGRQVRQVWADFARGRLAEHGEVPGALRYARVRPGAGQSARRRTPAG